MDRDPLRRHFRDALAADPRSAYRDWFRAQEELCDAGRDADACTLADDLWEQLPSLGFADAGARARFLHNAAVFYGSPGPAAHLARARALFSEALGHFTAAGAGDDGGWHARTLHNFATALSNLGADDRDLAEAIALFERALLWRTTEQEIARGVTLHNLGLAWRRRADVDPPRASAHLAASAAALEEAIVIRERQGLVEGLAGSQRQLAVTRARQAGTPEESR